MSLQKSVTDALKIAMKLKDTTSLTALRSIKSALLLFQTKKSQSGFMSQIDEINLLQKFCAGASASSQKTTVLIFNFVAAIESILPSCPPPSIPRVISDIFI